MNIIMTIFRQGVTNSKSFVTLYLYAVSNEDVNIYDYNPKNLGL